ncbi:hypothetical protein HDU67_004327, partial [Dinochytrium kinnereticum]
LLYNFTLCGCSPLLSRRRCSLLRRGCHSLWRVPLGGGSGQRLRRDTPGHRYGFVTLCRDSDTRRQIRPCVEAAERIRWFCAGQQPLWDICGNGMDVELTQMFAEAGQARPKYRHGRVDWSELLWRRPSL